MSLFQRRARPLNRDTARLRDDRLFIVACDDTFAPKQYFEFFRVTRVKIHVVPTTDGTSVAKNVLDRLLEFDYEPDDELWMLLDTDHCAQGTHLHSFTEALRVARQRGVNVALSKPCFEFWLLMHHLDEAASAELTTCGEVTAKLRERLGRYDKTKLDASHYPLASVAEACNRAERLDRTVLGGDIPNSSTSRVYRLWAAIAEKALPSQLPTELRGLVP